MHSCYSTLQEAPFHGDEEMDARDRGVIQTLGKWVQSMFRESPESSHVRGVFVPRVERCEASSTPTSVFVELSLLASDTNAVTSVNLKIMGARSMCD